MTSTNMGGEQVGGGAAKSRGAARALARRVVLDRWQRVAPWTLVAAAGLTAGIVGVERWLGSELVPAIGAVPGWGWAFAASSVVALGGAWAWARRGRWSDVDAATELDDRLGTHGAVSSAIALEAETDPFARLAVERGERLAAEARASRAHRVRASMGWAVWPVASAGVVAAGMLLPYASGGVLAEREREAAELAETAEELRRVSKELASGVGDEGVEQIGTGDRDARLAETEQRVEQELAAIEQELREGLVTPEVARERASGALSEQAEALEREAEDERAAAEEIADRVAEQQGEGEPSALREALGQGEFGAAREALRELAQNRESMSETERQELAEDLRELSRAVQERPSSGETQSDLDPSLLQEFNGQTDPDAIHEALEERGVSPEDASRLGERLAEENQAAEREREAERLGEALDRAADELDEPNASDPDAGNKDGGRPGQDEPSGMQGDQPAEEPAPAGPQAEPTPDEGVQPTDPGGGDGPETTTDGEQRERERTDGGGTREADEGTREREGQGVDPDQPGNREPGAQQTPPDDQQPGQGQPGEPGETRPGEQDPGQQQPGQQQPGQQPQPGGAPQDVQQPGPEPGQEQGREPGGEQPAGDPAAGDQPEGAEDGAGGQLQQEPGAGERPERAPSDGDEAPPGDGGGEGQEQNEQGVTPDGGTNPGESPPDQPGTAQPGQAPDEQLPGQNPTPPPGALPPGTPPAGEVPQDRPGPDDPGGAAGEEQQEQPDGPGGPQPTADPATPGGDETPEPQDGDNPADGGEPGDPGGPATPGTDTGDDTPTGPGGVPGGANTPGQGQDAWEQLDERLGELEEREQRAEDAEQRAREMREQAERLWEEASEEERERIQEMAERAMEERPELFEGMGDGDQGGPADEPLVTEPEAEFVPVDARPDDATGDGGQTIATWETDGEQGAPGLAPPAQLNGATLNELAGGAERAIEQQAVPPRYEELLRRVYRRAQERALEEAEAPPPEIAEDADG